MRQYYKKGKTVEKKKSGKTVKVRDINKDGKKEGWEVARAKGMAKGMGARLKFRTGGDTHVTKEGKTAKEGLWYNIAMKRKRGEKMRKKGDKGAPTAKAIKKSQG